MAKHQMTKNEPKEIEQVMALTVYMGNGIGFEALMNSFGRHGILSEMLCRGVRLYGQIIRL